MGAGVTSGSGRNDPRRPFVRGYPLVAVEEVFSESRKPDRLRGGGIAGPDNCDALSIELGRADSIPQMSDLSSKTN